MVRTIVDLLKEKDPTLCMGLNGGVLGEFFPLERYACDGELPPVPKEMTDYTKTLWVASFSVLVDVYDQIYISSKKKPFMICGYLTPEKYKRILEIEGGDITPDYSPEFIIPHLLGLSFRITYGTPVDNYEKFKSFFDKYKAKIDSEQFGFRFIQVSTVNLVGELDEFFAKGFFGISEFTPK